MKQKFAVTPELLKKSFIEIYGTANNIETSSEIGNTPDFYGPTNQIRIFAAPARINIIGEHIDYNGGFVFPAAIDRYLYCAIRKRTDTKIIYNDLFFPGTFSFDINETFKFDKANDYANYLNGILHCMKKHGYSFSCGFEVLIASNIPAAGGLSSSSALECCFGWAVNETFAFGISRKDLALMGQQSEHEFMNVNCGIMDQYIISTAKADTAELLDCAKLKHEYVPLKTGDYRFVVMNTKKQRRLSESSYNERRAQCAQGLKLLQAAGLEVPDLCSLTPEIFSKAGTTIFAKAGSAFFSKAGTLNEHEIIFRRVRHCVTENDRVVRAVAALHENNLQELGRLLYASHQSLRDDYEVTGLELDTLVNAAGRQQGCLGARMTGAGFGGCAIALVHKAAVQEFVQNVQLEYKNTIGYEAEFFECSTSDGVHEV